MVTSGNGNQQEAWREVLKTMSRCPICGQSYQGERVRLLLQKESSSLIHSTCSQCHGSFMAMVVLAGRGLSSVGMVTDLSFEDVQRLYRAQPLSLDEVIEGYRFFKQHGIQEILK